MKKLFGLALLISVVCSCNMSEQQFSFRDISEFKIDTTALKDGESVTVIYNSGAPDEKPVKDYYIHLIVISNVNHDTVNVLATQVCNVSENDNVRNFIIDGSDVDKIIQNLDKIPELIGKKLSDVESKKYTRVVSNSKCKNIEKNNYPTLIGTLGVITNDGRSSDSTRND